MNEETKYAILRTEKIKSPTSMISSEKHNTRERMPLNADPTRTHLNRIIIGSPESQTLVDHFNQMTAGMKVRSDAVRAIEVLMTYTPDGIKENQQEEWIKANRTWLESTFGKDNVVGLYLHIDETTPHLHAHIIPISKERLCAKDYLGGKAKLQAMQTSYAKVMEPFGLERGIRHSTATHEQIKTYHSNIQKLQEPLPKAKLLETGNSYQQRTEQQWIVAQNEIRKLKKQNKELKSSHKNKDTRMNSVLRENVTLRNTIAQIKKQFQRMYLEPEFGHKEIDRLYKESQINSGIQSLDFPNKER